MRHGVLAIALYVALVAELADVRLPGGLQPWWLDLVLLLVLRSLGGLSAMVWCTLLGLMSDIFNQSSPGLGLIAGATLGWRVSETSVDRSSHTSHVSLPLVAVGLLVWHTLTAHHDTPQSIESLPLLRSGATLLFVGVLEATTELFHRARQSQLLEASRS